MKEPILEFNGKKTIENKIKNEINLTIKIDKRDLNLRVYILNNPYSSGKTFLTENIKLMKQIVVKEIVL